MYKVKGRPLILASGSPRRSEMLSQCGVDFEKQVSDCDETVIVGETPQAMVERLSLLKAKTVAENFPDRWVLGADTTVVLESKILGKPVDEAEALLMLSLIQGHTHEVWGSYSLVHSKGQIHFTESHVSKVTIVPLTESDIKSYIQTGEPMDKAGSYAIQGVGASIVSEVHGSYTNVVGLNLSAVISALIRYGVVSRG